ncbi:hypothetical protein AAG906_027628 [Vitis piasezkii]
MVKNKEAYEAKEYFSISYEYKVAFMRVGKNRFGSNWLKGLNLGVSSVLVTTTMIITNQDEDYLIKVGPSD